jgi:hypothetical protein
MKTSVFCFHWFLQMHSYYFWKCHSHILFNFQWFSITPERFFTWSYMSNLNTVLFTLPSCAFFNLRCVWIFWHFDIGIDKVTWMCENKLRRGKIRVFSDVMLCSFVDRRLFFKGNICFASSGQICTNMSYPAWIYAS